LNSQVSCLLFVVLSLYSEPRVLALHRCFVFVCNLLSSR
jgi:hypothetical protein